MSGERSAEKGRYVLTFHSTSHSMRAEKLAAARFRVSVIPTPTEITHMCGFALLMRSGTREEITAFVEELGMPCVLYDLGDAGAGGRQAPAPVARHEGGGAL